VSEVLLPRIEYNERLAAGIFCSNSETWCRANDFVLYHIEGGVGLLVVRTLGFCVSIS